MRLNSFCIERYAIKSLGITLVDGSDLTNIFTVSSMLIEKSEKKRKECIPSLLLIILGKHLHFVWEDGRDVPRKFRFGLGGGGSIQISDQLNFLMNYFPMANLYDIRTIFKGQCKMK